MIQIRSTAKILLFISLFLFTVTTINVLAQDELVCGDSIKNSIDGDTASFLVVVEEGQFVGISLESEDFDTYLEAYVDDELVFSNDDGGEGLNSYLTISTAGEYEIIVSSFSEIAEGDYELSIQCTEECQSFEDELDEDNPALVYESEAEEGNTVLAYLYSEDFDTYLSLLDEDEEILEYNDDANGFTDSLLAYEFEDDASYSVEVTSFSGDEEGDFLLLICDAGDVELPVADLSYPILECGDTAEGTISDEFPINPYYFEGAEGDEVTIILSAADGSDLDPYLALYSPSSIQDDETFLENDDSDGLNSEISLELEEDGFYIINATRYNFIDGTSTGDFVLELECD